MIQFFDENGINPLPPGITVTVTLVSDGSVVGTAVTTAGGLAAITLSPSTDYATTFKLSNQAPPSSASCTFTSNADGTQTTNATVLGYVSPVKVTGDYASTSTNVLYPKGWFNDTARAPGGVAYAVATIFAAGLASVDAYAQIVQGAMRLQSCTGSEIDSWAADFFGNYLRRFNGEPDSAYIGRIIAMLQMPRTTLAAIQNVVNAFFAAAQWAPVLLPGENLTADSQGSLDGQGSLDQAFRQSLGNLEVTEAQATDAAGATDTSGALDTTPTLIVPYVTVWDQMSQPQLAAEYNVVPPQFVIQIGTPPKRPHLSLDTSGSLDSGQGSLDEASNYTLADSAFDSRLTALVNFVKAEGTHPRYLLYKGAIEYTVTTARTGHYSDTGAGVCADDRTGSGSGDL